MKEFSWIILLGGFSFFFFGLNYARGGLQLLAGERLRLAIARMTGNRFSALGLGALITVMLQSSTATLLMLVSLAATDLLTLTQAFGVILGADIGTTFVVILLSIKKISEYALLLVVFGFFMEWRGKESLKLRYTGRILFGFGMLFYGMHLITQTAGPLATDPTAQILLGLMAANPIALLLVSLLLTALVQTSAAVIGMAIAMGLAGVLNLSTAIPIILGANVGTCVAVMVASLGGNVNGRRVAVAHLFVKTAGVILAMPFVVPIAGFVEKISGGITALIPAIQPGVAGNIAIVHLFFNAGLALLFVPFLAVGVWVVTRLVPDRRRKRAFGPKYLEKEALNTPSLAFAQAKREILRVANLTYDVYRDGLKMFDKNADPEKWIAEIAERDDKIDLLDRAIRFYLAKISQEHLTDSQSQQEMALLGITADLEGIGDIISKEMISLARKKTEKARVFSLQGWKELLELHAQGLEDFSLTVSILTSPNEELIKEMIRRGEQFSQMEEKLCQAHFQRLHVGAPETLETSSVHLDILANLKRIHALLVQLAEAAPKAG